MEAIARTGLDRTFPDATKGDLVLELLRRRRQQFPDCGCLPLEETAGHVAGARRRRRLLGRRTRDALAA